MCSAPCRAADPLAPGESDGSQISCSLPWTPVGGPGTIANTAGFHFAFIEQGGTSLYPSLAQRVTSPEVLRILLSIGPTETAHFQTWHDKAGNAPPLTDSTNPSLVFPDLNAAPLGGENFQTNPLLPAPAPFLRPPFPVC